MNHCMIDAGSLPSDGEGLALFFLLLFFLLTFLPVDFDALNVISF